MSDEEFRGICVGGPLDGQWFICRAPYLRAIVPEESTDWWWESPSECSGHTQPGRWAKVVTYFYVAGEWRLTAWT